MTKLYGTMENAGGWRFMGPTHATAKLAQAYCDRRKALAINTKPKLQQSGESRMPAIDIGQLDLTSEVLPQMVEMPIHVYTMIVVALSRSPHHTAGTVLRILEKPDGLD